MSNQKAKDVQQKQDEIVLYRTPSSKQFYNNNN